MRRRATRVSPSRSATQASRRSRDNGPTNEGMPPKKRVRAVSDNTPSMGPSLVDGGRGQAVSMGAGVGPHGAVNSNSGPRPPALAPPAPRSLIESNAATSAAVALGTGFGGAGVVGARAEVSSDVGRYGPWSKEEDEALRLAAAKYEARNWKAVAEELGSGRTAIQCLQHWNKVLNPGLSKGPWRGEEDDVVLKMVKESSGGRVRWSEIAWTLRTRSSKQVRERWVNHLNPDIKKGPWSADEDRVIADAQRELGNKWVEIAKRVSGRTENSVKNRWHCIRQRQERRTNAGKGTTSFRRARDVAAASVPTSAAAAAAAVTVEHPTMPTNSRGPRAPGVIPPPTAAAAVGARFRRASEAAGTGASSAAARKGPWSKAEDEALRRAAERYEMRNWKLVAKELGDTRTAAQCLHHWTKVLKPGLSKGPWTVAEDEKLKGEVAKFANAPDQKIRWSEIAVQLPGRLAKQVRERWVNHLDPTVKKAPWSEEEDDRILRAQEEHGNKWVVIAALLPGRTENSVKNRWHCLKAKARRARYLMELKGATGSGLDAVATAAAEAGPMPAAAAAATS